MVSELSEERWRRDSEKQKQQSNKIFISRLFFWFEHRLFAVELQPVTTWLELNFGEVLKRIRGNIASSINYYLLFSLINFNLTHLRIARCHEHTISNKYKTNSSYSNFCRLSSSRSIEREGKRGKFDHNGTVSRLVSVYNKCGIKSIFKLKIINCILFRFSLQGHKTRRAWMKWGLVTGGCKSSFKISKW